MVRFYCLYCKSYLTHDTASVRKSHLQGKNHIRLVADYYRNVSINEEKRQRKSTKKRKRLGKTPNNDKEQRIVQPVAIHCPTNKKKRMAERLKKRDVLEEFDVLNEIYKGSPGYERVFKPENRVDVGHLLKVSKHPQRGNIHTNTTTGVSTKQNSKAQSQLPPPRTLTSNNTYSTKFHDPSLLQQSINHTVKQIKRQTTA